MRRLLQPFTELSENSHDQDEKISETFKELSGLPRDMFSLLEEEPENFGNCPLNDDAPDDIRIPYAQILESRLNELNEPAKTRGGSTTPEIRLEADVSTPGISITSFDSEIWANGSAPKTLLDSRTCMFGNAHARHCSVLLRLLYLHNAVNPAKASSHTASLLVPLYSAMVQEVDTEELAHVEADTFWLLESIVAELSEVDEDGRQVWMAELGKRLAWADYDFFTELVLTLLVFLLEALLIPFLGFTGTKSYFSTLFLVSDLTLDIMQNVYMNQQVVGLHLCSLILSPFMRFFRPGTHSFHESLEEKVSTQRQITLLISVRPWFSEERIISIGMFKSVALHLPRYIFVFRRIWKSGETSRSLWTNEGEPSSRTRAQDPFLQSLSFLQTYDLKFVGGIDRILQTAAELAQRRQLQPVAVQSSGLGLRSRFNFWGSATAAVSNSQTVSRNLLSAEPQSKQSGLTSEITTTFWRGITNQTAMEDEVPSPESYSPIETQNSADIPEDTSASSYSRPSPNMWSYAEKIKDSDTVATLSKVSTNWRAKGILSVWRSTPNSSPPMPPSKNMDSNPDQGDSHAKASETRELAEKPSKFRDSQSPPSSGSLVDKTKSLFSARSPTPKSGPKPLLLNSRLSYSQSPKSSADSLAVKSSDSDTKDEWAEVMKLKRHHIHRESQSSASSLSPSDAFIRNPRSARSDRESDTATSRIVPLNRRAVSPMAPHYRRPSSGASSASSDIHSPLAKVRSPLHESSSIDVLVRGKAPSISESEPESSDTTSYQPNMASRNLALKSDNIEDIIIRPGIPSRASRVRTRRYQRPPNLQISDSPGTEGVSGPKSSESSSKNLKVDWPTDNHDSLPTPRAVNFDSEEHSSILSEPVRSPRRSPSKRDLERMRKVSTDKINEERPRKVSTRSRKVSVETREASKGRRSNAAEDGDDEGYDELLSAYESEDTNDLGLGPRT